jgi:hypothetical protein
VREGSDTNNDQPGEQVQRPRGEHGLVATAAKVGAAYYAFGLILLPTLAFVGLVTFHRVLQSGIEDLGDARRIARLCEYSFRYAPELTGYLLELPEQRLLPVQQLRGGVWERARSAPLLVGDEGGTWTTRLSRPEGDRVLSRPEVTGS